MATGDDLPEELFRPVIEGGGHRLAVINPWPGAEAFLGAAGGHDVILLTNLGLPWDYVRGLIAPACRAGNAKVIVMSGVADQEDRERAIREGAVAFYALPISGERILEAVESAAGGRV
jgi:DNA-binding NarL/FixJ family response regulator